MKKIVNTILGIFTISTVLLGQGLSSQVPSLDFPDYAEPILTEESDLQIHLEFLPDIAKDPCFKINKEEDDVFETNKDDLSMDNYTDISKAPCFTKEWLFNFNMLL